MLSTRSDYRCPFRSWRKFLWKREGKQREPKQPLSVGDGIGLSYWYGFDDVDDEQEYERPVRHTSLDTQEPVSAAQRLAVLQQQRRILEAEIAELTEIVALEVQQEAMLVDPVSALEATPIAQE